MPRSELDFHVYRPELGELPARANTFNDLVQSRAAPAMIPNPALPAPPTPKIGDTISIRFSTRYSEGGPVRRVDVLHGFTQQPAMSCRVISDYDGDFGSMAAEKDDYDQWLKEREASLQSRGLSRY